MDYLEELAKTLEKIDGNAIKNAVDAIIETRSLGGTVYTAGNGGSAATAMHFTNDLMKLAGSRNISRYVKSVCLSANPAVLTCLSNDLGYDEATVAEVLRLVDRAEYKRRQAPPGVRITQRAFGKDRRLPITNHYREG